VWGQSHGFEVSLSIPIDISLRWVSNQVAYGLQDLPKKIGKLQKLRRCYEENNAVVLHRFAFIG